MIPCESRWFGVTYPEDKEYVIEALATLHQQGDYPPRSLKQSKTNQNRFRPTHISAESYRHADDLGYFL